MTGTDSNVKTIQTERIEELNWLSESCESLSSVHTIETTGRQLPPRLKNAGFSHVNPGLLADSAWLYDVIDWEKLRSRGDDIRTCRTGCWLVRHKDSGLVRLATNGCGLRWCPKCAEARLRYLGYSIGTWCEDIDRPKLLTLTLKHTSSPLLDQHKYLHKCFRKLRRFKEFRSHVRGGIWCDHVKKSDNDDLWHPHIHCIIDADFYPHRMLKRTWRKVTHSSSIVDIRPISDTVGAAYDVARYATNPCHQAQLSSADRVTAYYALEGRRLCGTWGTARGISLKPGRMIDKEMWQNVGSLSVVQAFYFQDPSARAIGDALIKGVPLAAGVTMNRMDAVIDNIPMPSWYEVEPNHVKTKSRSPPCEAQSLF